MSEESPSTRSFRSLARIYRDPAVRQRIRDYLGEGESEDSLSALYLSRCDGCPPHAIRNHAVGELDALLENPIDLARSLADRNSLIAHLDIEHVDFESPASAYVDPGRSFRLMEPVVTAIEEALTGYGIRPLHLLTGQGHHFVWSIPLSSPLIGILADEISPFAPEGSSHPPAPGETCEAAFEGLGLVMEFLAGEIRRAAIPASDVPVDFTAVDVGRLPNGRREIISLDLSEYGDPLLQRVIRIPFTHYLKPWQNGMFRHLGLEDEIPPFATVPLFEMDTAEALRLRQNADSVVALARRSLVRIPRQERGTRRLIQAYLASPLRKFHQFFYGEARKQGPIGLGEDEVAGLPGCVRRILTFPNDLLLKPVCLQLVTRYFLARGWHPRCIADLVREKFDNPVHDWMPRYWDVYRSDLRAEFYVRIFAGEIATGADRAVDFNCVSTKEKGFCFDEGCQHNLEDDCRLLLASKWLP